MKRRIRPAIRKRRKAVGSGAYRRGVAAGFPAGYEKGMADPEADYLSLFNGTSIIIPTYNNLPYLKGCIASLIRHTEQPYEVIVIDNGSTDGTEAYLKSLLGRQRLRYKRFNDNLGFAGGVNQGLLMAKGTSIVILNNDTVLTRNWLANLLTCLHSSPTIGLVGPVTNYLSNDQRINVNYRNLKEMHAFAADYNQSDPARWRRSTDIMGFCIALRRDVLMRVGYMDEGYSIGTCEDVDFYLRIRLLGLELVIAEDTFIHHYGSVTMRSFLDASVSNQLFFQQKWGGAQQLNAMEGLLQSGASGPERSMIDYCPSHVIVEALDGSLYWIENGQRHRILARSVEGWRTVRLPQPDIWAWPLGPELSPESVHARLRQASAGGALVEGAVLRAADGACYQFVAGLLRRFLSEQALIGWRLDERKSVQLSAADREQLGQGLVIIAPVTVKARNI
jgi:GT2 family glycosyltransferase